VVAYLFFFHFCQKFVALTATSEKSSQRIKVAGCNNLFELVAKEVVVNEKDPRSILLSKNARVSRQDDATLVTAFVYESLW